LGVFWTTIAAEAEVFSAVFVATSVAAGAYHTRLSAWRFVGRYRAPDGLMAVRAAKPLV
jgi:hypothetical protein